MIEKPLRRPLAASCAIHAGLALIFFVLIGLHAPPKPVEVCDFVLQSANEPNNEKTNRIAEHSAKAHGMRAPVDPNKVDGGHVGQQSKPTPDAAGHKAIAHRQHMNARQIAHAQAHPKPIHQRRTQPMVAHKPMPKAHSPVRIAHKPITHAHIAQAPAPPTPTHTRSHERATEETEIASGNTGSAPHRASTFHRFLGRFLNPDKDTDNRAASYSARQSADFGPYMAYLHRVLERAWRPPDTHGLRLVIVSFKIHRSGDLSGLRLSRSSGNSTFDRSAIAAVQSAAPFRALPEGAPAAVDIEYTFDFREFHR